MHEGGLDHPLEVLAGGDGVEAWDELTAARHHKLLLLCGGGAAASQGSGVGLGARVGGVVPSLAPKVPIHPLLCE